jgi:hypothetical protein
LRVARPLELGDNRPMSAPRITARALACTAAFVCVLTGRPLRALADSAGGDVAATALFDEGRRLMAARNYADACPKLAESERLAPSGGTLLNLAECYEHTGQTASAWVAWKDAAARANAAGKAQAEKMALDRAAALEPKLARLAVAVAPESDVKGLEIKRDGVILGRAEYSLPIPVDPGTHVIEARAPKKKALSAQIDVAPKQVDARVTVELSDDVPLASAAPPAATPASASPPGETERLQSRDGGGQAQRTASWVVLGAGVVGVAVGAVFGLEAKSNNDEALEPQNCRTSAYCTQKGLTLTSDAKDDATVSTVAFVVGGAALATGAILWLTAPSGGGIHVAPTVGRSFGGAVMVGTF